MKKVKQLKCMTACIILGMTSRAYAESNTIDVGSNVSNFIENATGYKTGSVGISGHTENYPVLSDYMHYAIGGGSAISAPASRGSPHQYGIGIGWKSNLTCGKFDIKFSIKNQLNGITEGFKDLYGNIIQSATRAVASLPAMIIQRANPQLYDILSNGLYQGKIDFNNFKTSCEAMSNQLADLAMDSKLAKMAGLQRAAEIAETETDAMAARKKIDKRDAEKGIPWVGGEQRGGKDQKPMAIVADIVGAGYNLALGRGPLEKGDVPIASCDGMLCTEWKNPEEAAAYANEILGETFLDACATCQESQSSAKAGKGVAHFIEKTTIEKATKLEAALNNLDGLTPEQLNSLSTSTVFVTKGVLEAIAASPDAALLGARLSQELAISKEMEKLLLIRRAMLAGMREPNVIKSSLVEEAERNLKLLDREIEQVKLEMELQRSINGNTALVAITQRMNEQAFAVDDNSLGDSNRRFANLSNPAGANNLNTGDVANSARQAVGTRHIVIPKSDGTGMSDFYGTYKASPTNIASNVNVGNYTQIAQVNGNAAEQATALLKQFEGYLGQGKWDVNAYRAGYGSDTYTTADGRVHRVEKGTVVSREDAERDLARRMPQFMNTARRNVGADVWEKLTPAAQAVLTSVSYNYGSLSKLESVRKAAAASAQSGDMTALANSIRNLQGHNNGINARRRNQEADYIVNAQKGN
ncbi:integrating conjugative element protein [Muribacter muris]|uniref:Integrating conjugative element protein n=1 Tax=Muribacter muris TaxID=67855 RepID=A0A4Y9JSX0_9PAST|nr:integrating conjugative element protein [Muribacter muris]MBF0786138.1 integrating conjugative element protein [Muribacter muris]MBF0827341.1 integrating conjugative element protein [Muribacter muris]TFV07810.1 integrating conjugative element protein [Muribacter muris]